jgi:hypothetical protein
VAFGNSEQCRSHPDTGSRAACQDPEDGPT